jgi:hypothetical protein
LKNPDGLTLNLEHVDMPSRFASSMTNLPLYAVVLIALGIAFFRVHLRVKTTLVGYEIGRLKATEGRLLAEKSELSVELARLTGKDALQARESSGEPGALKASTTGGGTN